VGILTILSAPSGAGKTSLCRAAVKAIPNLTHSVSYTTRRARAGEEDGRDYYFVDEDTFHRMIRQGEFLEWARVHGHLYGTSKRVVEGIRSRGCDVILDVDAAGAGQLMALSDLKAVYVFVLTPTFSELEKRLRGRASDSEEEIQRRLKRAKEEIARFDQYDYLLINDDFDQALSDLVSILRAEKCSNKHVDHQWVYEEFLERRIS